MLDTSAEDIEMNGEMTNANELALESEPQSDPLAITTESLIPPSSQLATAAQTKDR